MYSNTGDCCVYKLSGCMCLKGVKFPDSNVIHLVATYVLPMLVILYGRRECSVYLPAMHAQ